MVQVYIQTLLLVCLILWTVPTNSQTCEYNQQNNEFLELLKTKPPVSINLASEYDYTKGVVSDARGLGGTILAPIFSPTLQFPPVGATISFGSPSGMSTTMTVSDAEFGNGVSTLRWSSQDGNNARKAFNLFNPSVVIEGVHFSYAQPRSYANGDYIGSNFIESEYRGDWLMFTSPECFIMQSSGFIPRDNVPSRSVGLYKIYAKNNDNDPWIPIYTHSTRSPYPSTIISINLDGRCYLQYALVVNKLFGTGVVDYVLNLYSWKIMGTYDTGETKTIEKYGLSVSDGEAIQFPPSDANAVFGSIAPNTATMTISNAAVANGEWRLAWSSNNNYQYWPFNVFNPSVDTFGAKWEEAMYTGSGVYQGQASLDGGVYKGDWISFKAPSCLRLQTSSFIPGAGESNSPGLYWIYAKNLDADPWIPVYKNIVNKYPTGIVSINIGDVCYSQYALVVSRLYGTGDVLNFLSWKINGVHSPPQVFTPSTTQYPMVPCNAGNCVIHHDPILSAHMTVENEPYGNGVYYFEWSSQWKDDSTYENSPIFLLVGPGWWGTDAPHWDLSSYSSTGTYKGTSTLDGVFFGDWFKVTYPTCYKMEESWLIPPGGKWTIRGAGKYKIYARMYDNDPWIVIHFQSTVIPDDFVLINTYGRCYLQYAFVVNEVSGDSSVLGVRQWHTKGVYFQSTTATATAGFNSVYPVTSLYAPVATTWTWPTRPAPTYTRCWTTRNTITTDWKVACFKNEPSEYVIDQVDSGSPGETPFLIDPATDNHIHAIYTWDGALTTAEMKIVTAGLRKELAGVPLSARRAVAPIEDLRAYYLRLLLAIRPPQSINIFADITGTGVGSRVPNRMGPGFEATLTAGTVSKVTTTEADSGAVNPITTVVGTTSAKFLWPENSVPVPMTICSVTRYMPGTTGRILTAYFSPTQGANWLHGHVLGRRGNAYYINQNRVNSNTLGVKFDWLIMCGSTSNDWPGNFVIDQLDLGIDAPNPHKTVRLNINYSNQKSNFNVHSVYIWNAELSNRQMKVVTTALRAQLGGIPDGTDQVPVVPMEVSPTAYCAQCPVGYFMNGCTDSCTMCPVNTYGIGCTNCPEGTISPMGSEEISECICAVGYTSSLNGVKCTACVDGTYKKTTGPGLCSECPSGAHSQDSSTSEGDCGCIEGYFLDA